MSSSAPRWTIAPLFIVEDIVATANFYRDKLGFRYERIWGEPPCFTLVQRGGITIMLKQLGVKGLTRPNAVADPHRETWDAYIWVEDADALLAEFKSQGMTIARDIGDQSYNCREFDIDDCNGYRICFAHTIER